MNMKKVLLLLLFFVLENNVYAQIMTCAYYDGYWGKWKSHTTRSEYSTPRREYLLFGNYDGFIVYKTNNHPSEYMFKFKIDNYWEPDKKEKKRRSKNVSRNIVEWYEYSGTVEYYVTEEYPTIYEVLKKYGFPCFNLNSGSTGNPCVKRTTTATIKIYPYYKHPFLYNIYFDGVGVGIYMDYDTHL